MREAALTERCIKRASIVASVRTLLAFVVLFSVGPQLGSLDADGDGIPEVPIMVLAGTDAADVLSVLDHTQHTTFIGPTLSLFPPVIPDTFEYIGIDFVSELNAFALLPFCPLRC